ncbi:hypothetical protein K0M31_010059, partial [Melipona bicolor]
KKIFGPPCVIDNLSNIDWIAFVPNYAYRGLRYNYLYSYVRLSNCDRKWHWSSTRLSFEPREKKMFGGRTRKSGFEKRYYGRSGGNDSVTALATPRRSFFLHHVVKNRQAALRNEQTRPAYYVLLCSSEFRNTAVPTRASTHLGPMCILRIVPKYRYQVSYALCRVSCGVRQVAKSQDSFNSKKLD